VESNKLRSIPRVESRAPNKNTIEWEIPDQVSVGLMLIERIGFTFIAKVKVKKKHWWHSSHKTFTVSSSNPMEAVIKVSEFLEGYGYYIDSDSIAHGEIVGFQ
jgi:hypothetical protein